MGLIAIVSSALGSASSSASVSAISLVSSVGLGLGGIFVAGALVYLFSYFDLLDQGATDTHELQRTVLATIIPLTVVFAGILLFKTIQFI